MDDGSGKVDELILEPAPSGRPSRPRGLWAVLAAVAVAVGAVAVSSAGDDDPPRPGLPVALGASVAARDASGAADAMLAWVTYVPGDELPALGGEAPAYRLSSNVSEDQVRDLADALGLDGQITQDGPEWRVSDASGTLAVAAGGTATWWYSSPPRGAVTGSGSSSGSAGCTAGEECTTVTATAPCPADGDGDCGIAPTTSTTIVCGPGADCVEPALPPDCAVSSDGSTSCPDVEEPYLPADLPSADEARAIALDLLAATGVDLEGAEVVVDGPYDAWYVSVEPLVDGVPSGLVAAVTVGSGGAVRDATGNLAVAEHLGDYPLLDTRATIDRANSQAGFDAVPAVASDTDQAASDEPVTTITATTVPLCKVQPDGSEICETTSGDAACATSAEDDAGDGTRDCVLPDLPKCPQAAPPVDEPLGAPESIECTPPRDPGLVPEPLPGGPIEVVLVDAEPALAPLTAVDGSTDVYLVPAYRFTDADGGRVDLPAVADSTLTTPPTTDTSAVDPGEPPATVPDTLPCEVLVEDDGSGTTHTIQPDPDCQVREPIRLPDGEEPQIGVGYYVDVVVGHCTYVEFGGWFWSFWAGDGAADPESDWATPTEGGTFTLRSETEADFVGDAAGTKVGRFTRESAEGLACA